MKRLLLAFYRFYLHFCKDDLETALEERSCCTRPTYRFERSSEELSEQLDQVNEELERINR